MKKIVAFLAVSVVIYNLMINYMFITYSKYSIDKDLIKQISSNIPNYTSIDKIPDNLKKAVIAVEDKRFYRHYGIDIISIGRAIFTDIKAGKIKEGGSTITQQLAKNLFLSNDRSFRRKLQELYFTAQLEHRYTKDQILEMYLNVIYYGSNTYGAENASKKYFNKDIKDLSLAECAMLAGIPQSPNAYNPRDHFDKAKKRQEAVLDAMFRNKFIDSRVEKENKKQLVFIASF